MTDDEVGAFAATVEEAAANGNIAVFNSAIDWEAILDKAMDGVEAPEPFRRSFRDGMKAEMGTQKGFAGAVRASTQPGGSYKLLRGRVRDKQTTALFRMVSKGQGLNYHEFMLARRLDGKARAVDVYIYYSGDMLSETIRRIYVQGAAVESRGILSRLVGADQDFIKNASKLQEMSAATNAGKGRDAMQIFDQLPVSLQKDKTYLLTRLTAARTLDDKTYSESIERFQKLYPRDAAVDIHSIDGFLLMKQYDKAIRATNRVDKSVGGDPHLNKIRLGVYLKADQFDKARETAEAIVEDDPKLVGNYWSLVAIQLKQNDYPATLKTLKTLDERFVLKFKDFSTVPVYSGFVKSPQFAEWKSYLEKKAESHGGEVEAFVITNRMRIQKRPLPRHQPRPRQAVVYRPRGEGQGEHRIKQHGREGQDPEGPGGLDQPVRSRPA